MSKNVLIPRSSLERIIEMMECIDFARLPNYYDYLDVLRDLKVKMQKLELRDAYSGIIRAGDDDARTDARIEYLRQKSEVGNVDV
jgi:hypothetical protein